MLKSSKLAINHLAAFFILNRSISISSIKSAAVNIKNTKNEKIDKYQELKKLTTRPLYLDTQATSPIDPRVLDAMLPYMTNMYGNPHSRTHAYGWESEKAVETAREVRFSK